MALPKLETPTYELEQPSTGEKIKYRPFLVKEQKTLMMAQESGDEKQIKDSLASLISNCTFEKIDPYTVPIFDIELLFLRIRGKSVGEKVDLNLLCPDDNETRVAVDINLEDVGVSTNDDHTNEVELTKDIKIVMKYPTLSDMTGFDDKGQVLVIFEMIKNCIQEIHSGEEIYNRVDISSKELDEFIENMSTQYFDSLTNFFQTMPKVQHAIEVKNPKTKKKGEVIIEGIQNFFG